MASCLFLTDKCALQISVKVWRKLREIRVENSCVKLEFSAGKAELTVQDIFLLQLTDYLFYYNTSFYTTLKPNFKIFYNLSLHKNDYNVLLQMNR